MRREIKDLVRAALALEANPTEATRLTMSTAAKAVLKLGVEKLLEEPDEEPEKSAETRKDASS